MLRTESDQFELIFNHFSDWFRMTRNGSETDSSECLKIDRILLNRIQIRSLAKLSD